MRVIGPNIERVANQVISDLADTDPSVSLPTPDEVRQLLSMVLTDERAGVRLTAWCPRYPPARTLWMALDQLYLGQHTNHQWASLVAKAIFATNRTGGWR